MKFTTSLRVVLPAAAAAALLSAAALPAGAATMPKFAAPKAYGTSFQSDPHHDFTKHISPRHDGILRGWVTHYRSGVAEYEPIRWVKDKTGHTEGHFEGPPEGDVTAYASPVAKNVVFYSAIGCKGTTVTATNGGLGSKRCSRSELISRMKNVHHPALITVYRGKIVKVQEIYTP
ncbi:hypothetical protein [Microbispora sp. GKU 823]|uniref:hypothetical protein n=1 Tax=Microbispora sp. GKU 823 TaxID=1652100 RepID=UPI0009A42881|nr:hypothetical protein [Microbispora sp. GKU 823]OPG12296.1 hypothetical protein B1L11_14735 [Microbispora sp. GKU 823]